MLIYNAAPLPAQPDWHTPMRWPGRGIPPGTWSQRVDRHILHSEIAGLDVNGQGVREIDHSEERGLADAGRTDNEELHAERICDAPVSRGMMSSVTIECRAAPSQGRL